MEPFFGVDFVCACVTMFSLPAFSVLETMDSRALASPSHPDKVSSAQARCIAVENPGPREMQGFFPSPRTRVCLRKDQEKRKEIGKSKLPKRYSFPLGMADSFEQD